MFDGRTRRGCVLKSVSALLFVCGCVCMEASTGDALIDRDNGPLTSLYGFPDSREGSTLALRGEDAWEFHVSTSSHSMRDTEDGESILFDGETRRLGLSYRRGVSERLEVGIEVPWVAHESGGLDGFIDRWHDLFGLPEGIREERPRDELLFHYLGHEDEFRFNRNAQGVGDVRLLGGWRLQGSEQRSSALRFSVKLPTGDSDVLLGSGGTDVSLGFAGDVRQLIGVERLSGFYRTSATWLGRSDFDSRPLRAFVAQASAGLGYALTARSTLAAQVLVRSPVYDSAVSPLGDTAGALTLGVRFRLPKEYALTLAVGEDLHAGSMPDVTFAVSLQKR